MMKQGIKNFLIFLVIYWCLMFSFYTYFIEQSVHYEVLFWVILFFATVFFVKSAKDEHFNKWLMVYSVFILLLYAIIPHFIGLNASEDTILYLTTGIETTFAQHHVIYLAMAFALKKK